jgi:hypothetical protein
MLKLFVGIALMLLSIGMFVFAMYYGWVSGFPDVQPAAHSWYQSLSALFAVLSFCLIAAGAVIVLLAIRRMNADYKKERSDFSSERPETST